MRSYGCPIDVPREETVATADLPVGSSATGALLGGHLSAAMARSVA